MMLRKIFLNSVSQLCRGAHTKAAIASSPAKKIGEKSQTIFDKEDKYGAHNYHPMPVALCRGEGKNRSFSCYILTTNQHYLFETQILFTSELV